MSISPQSAKKSCLIRYWSTSDVQRMYHVDWAKALRSRDCAIPIRVPDLNPLHLKPFHRPGKPVEFSSFLNRRVFSQPQPFGGPVHLDQDRGRFYLAPLEDLLFPHLNPGLRGVAEHLRENSVALTFVRHANVRTKNDRPGTTVKQCREAFG